jgi:hypothetical protein
VVDTEGLVAEGATEAEEAEAVEVMLVSVVGTVASPPEVEVATGVATEEVIVVEGMPHTEG